MKKNKSINFIVPLVIYPFDLMVSINETDAQLEKVLDKYLYDEGTEWKWHNETAMGRFCLFSTNQGLIRLRHYPVTPTHYGYLQHEIFHYVTHILGRMGMKLILQKSDEAYAYLVGYITETIYQKINE